MYGWLMYKSPVAVFVDHTGINGTDNWTYLYQTGSFFGCGGPPAERNYKTIYKEGDGGGHLQTTRGKR